MRALTVWWEGAVVGSLTVDRHGAMRFAYDGGWVADPSAAPLSVSLPKRLEPFSPRACRPFFEGLLPEGAQRDAVAGALGVSPANEFALLERLGGEVAGALTFLYREDGMVLAPLYDLLSTVAYPELSPVFAMKVARRGTLEELRRGDWDRFAGGVGLGAPIVRRRVGELAGLALERAEGVADDLNGSGLDESALARWAARSTDRARRLALTV